MRISKIDNNKNTNFKGPLDGVITNTLRTLDTNPMANAVGIDLFAMVGPRTYVDTKERNKYAGAETFFREFTGTLIVCLSASLFAKGISKVANKLIKPAVKINPNSWFSKDSVNLLESAWDKSKNSTKNYVNNILDGISGLDGKQVKKYKDINFDKVEWTNERRLEAIVWDDDRYSGVYDKLKTKDGITDTIANLIEDKSITKKDKKNLLAVIESRVVNALGVSGVDVKIGDKTLSASVSNLLRDSVDMGRDVFTSEGSPKDKIEKINKINSVKSLGALTLASTLGLTNQYINRKITEKRTGTKGFVGDKNYNDNVKNKTSNKDKSKMLFAEKLMMSAGMALMALGVMKVKSPKDFVKKLEFTGPVTSGNVIKTVYASTLIGRFMASDSQDELRETATRDYLGFLNWLVFGGFASKGMANLLDRKRENLFNEHKAGKGVRHWLNDLSLKSHSEIASKGKEFAKKNMWKLNLAHVTGLAYSTLALGVLLPKLNIFITNKKQSNTDKVVANSLNDYKISSAFSKNRDEKFASMRNFRNFKN